MFHMKQAAARSWLAEGGAWVSGNDSQATWSQCQQELLPPWGQRSKWKEGKPGTREDGALTRSSRQQSKVTGTHSDLTPGAEGWAPQVPPDFWQGSPGPAPVPPPPPPKATGQKPSTEPQLRMPGHRGAWVRRGRGRWLEQKSLWRRQHEIPGLKTKQILMRHAFPGTSHSKTKQGEVWVRVRDCFQLWTPVGLELGTWQGINPREWGQGEKHHAQGFSLSS